MLFENIAYWPSWAILTLTIFAVLDAVLKLISLWKCGKNNQLVWFIFLAIFNTVGILPATYLIFFQKKTKKVLIKKENKKVKKTSLKKKPIKKKPSKKRSVKKK